MEPLKTNRRVLTWLCICLPNKDTRSIYEWIYAIFSWTVFTLNLCAFLFSALFFIKFISTDLESCLFALFQIFGAANVVYMTIIAFFHRQKIRAIFEGLSNIYAASKNEIITYQTILVKYSEILFSKFQIAIVILLNICNKQMIAANGCGEFT